MDHFDRKKYDLIFYYIGGFGSPVPQIPLANYGHAIVNTETMYKYVK